MSTDEFVMDTNRSLRTARQSWKVRLILSLLVGIAMTTVPLISGWISIRKEAKGAGGTDRLWYDLMSLNHALKQFQTHHERVPESIDELKVDRENESYIPLVDPWDRPYWLERKGDTCRIGSYGRDGRPGGVGLDAERSTDNQFPAESQLTLRQYLFEINSSDVWLCGALSGLLAAALTFRELRPGYRPGMTWMAGGILFAIWAVLSFYAAGVIAYLDLIPNGH